MYFNCYLMQLYTKDDNTDLPKTVAMEVQEIDIIQEMAYGNQL